MAKVEVNMDGELKADAEKIIQELGLTPSTAITVFYKQVVEQKKIPFALELSDKNKVIVDIQKYAEKLPVEKLDTKEKIENWLNEDEG